MRIKLVTVKDLTREVSYAAFVLNSKKAYGRVDVEITPVGGTRSAWVTSGSIRNPRWIEIVCPRCGTDQYLTPEAKCTKHGSPAAVWVGVPQSVMQSPNLADVKL